MEGYMGRKKKSEIVPVANKDNILIDQRIDEKRKMIKKRKRMMLRKMMLNQHQHQPQHLFQLLKNLHLMN